MHSLQPHDAIGVESACLTLAGIFLLLRLYVQAFILRKLSASDFLIVAAWLLFLSNVICDIYSNKYGMWNPGIKFTTSSLPDFNRFFADESVMVKVLKILYFSTPLYYLSLYFVKAAILLLYYRLFPPDYIKLRRALHFTTAFTALGCLLMLCFNLFWCVPIPRNWATTSANRCLAVASVPTYMVTATFHLISDLMIYALPLFLIRTLANTSTPKRKLVGIIVMFSLGFVCIAITVSRVILVALAASFPLIGATSSSEMASAIIVSACPPLKWVWSAKVEPLRKTSSGVCCVSVGLGSGGRSRASRSSGAGDRRTGGSVRGSRPFDTKTAKNEKILGKLRSSLFTKDSGINRTRTTKTVTRFSRFDEKMDTSPNWTATNTAETLSAEVLDEERSISVASFGNIGDTRNTTVMSGGLAPRERGLSGEMPPTQHGGVGVGSGWRKWLGIGNGDEFPQRKNSGRKKTLPRGEFGLSTFGGRRTRTNGNGYGDNTTFDAGASTIAGGGIWERERGKSLEERERARVREMLNMNNPDARMTPESELARDINDAELGVASRVHIRIHSAHAFDREGDGNPHDAQENNYDIPLGLGRGSFYADDEMMEEYRPRRIECMFKNQGKQRQQQREPEPEPEQNPEGSKWQEQQQPNPHKQLLQKKGGPIGSDFGGATFLTGPSSPDSSMVNGYGHESANYGSSIFGSSV